MSSSLKKPMLLVLKYETKIPNTLLDCGTILDHLLTEPVPRTFQIPEKNKNVLSKLKVLDLFRKSRHS